MARNVPWESIPKPKPPGLPKGAYLFEIEKMEEAKYNGLLTVNATFRVVEPEDYEGRLHFQTYYLGTEDDPEMEDPKTIVLRPMQDLKEHLLQSGTPLKGSLEKTMAAAVGRRVGFVFGEYTVKATRKDGTPNDNAGEVKSVIRKAFKEGEIPATGEGGGVAKKTAPVIAKPAAVAAAKPAAAKAEPAYDEDDD